MSKTPVSADELIELVRLAIRNGTTHALPDLVGQWAHGAVEEVARLRAELQAATETERKRCADIARKRAERNRDCPPKCRCGDGYHIDAVS